MRNNLHLLGIQGTYCNNTQLPFGVFTFFYNFSQYRFVYWVPSPIYVQFLMKQLGFISCTFIPSCPRKPLVVMSKPSTLLTSNFSLANCRKKFNTLKSCGRQSTYKRDSLCKVLLFQVPFACIHVVRPAKNFCEIGAPTLKAGSVLDNIPINQCILSREHFRSLEMIHFHI